MFKINEKVVSLLLIAFLVLTSSTLAYGQDHRLESLDIHVVLHQDASATITERRVAHLIEGTENYIIIENLGESEILSFKVEEGGTPYEYVGDWDINASRQEKAFRNGIIETSNGYELAWGIGEYGDHEYILEYRVSNFIKQLEDSQMVFWQFVNPNTNIPPQSVTVNIRSEDYDFSEEGESIWAFGYSGYIDFENGNIYAASDRPLSSQNYVTILTRFEDGLFASGDVINEDFDTVLTRARQGSDYGEDGGSSLGPLLGTMGTLVPLIFAGIFLFSSTKRSKQARKFKRKYKEEYYRDLPYKGDFIDVYTILYDMGASDFESLLTAFILKWIKEDRIIVQKDEKGFIRKREVTTLAFPNKTYEKDSLEGQLFDMLLSAAGSNKILEESEFTKWARSNHNKLASWEENVKTNSSLKLQDEGYLTTIEKKKLLIFKNLEIVLTSKGEELEEKVYKYVNYLHDFSLLNEHEAINVTIWDEIMVWAAILGMTERVMEEFTKLYPNYVQETIYSGNTILMTSHLTRNVSRARTQGSRSSGSGGRASFGGGSGSFGGGSGGGTR